MGCREEPRGRTGAGAVGGNGHHSNRGDLLHLQSGAVQRHHVDHGSRDQEARRRRGEQPDEVHPEHAQQHHRGREHLLHGRRPLPRARIHAAALRTQEVRRPGAEGPRHLPGHVQDLTWMARRETVNPAKEKQILL